jgi:glycosyltransferase involved in cell wall biosynthesis
LASRLHELTSTGIDRIDLAFANHFAAESRGAIGLHYGFRQPHVLSTTQVRTIVGHAKSLWQGPPGETSISKLLEWLRAPPRDVFNRRWTPSGQATQYSRARRHFWRAKARILHNSRLTIPDRAIYLNVAQHRFEFPRLFRWLQKRPDQCNVFMIHDLLPLDYPEYFVPSNLHVFRRRLDTACRYADAFLVSTQAVRERLHKELAQRTAPDRPIHVQPFPSPMEGIALHGSTAREQDGHPYFVMIGTIEPRKNHLLLLHLWRLLISQNQNSPRLVIVGNRGWEHEQVIDILDRSKAVNAHVVEVSGLQSADLLRLVGGARALLMPSFDEGYGLPLVEALSIGTPAIASDIPVFREVTQGRATFLSPLNGLAWAEEISRLSFEPRYCRSRRAEAALFEAPTWQGYFSDLEAFFASL